MPGTSTSLAVSVDHTPIIPEETPTESLGFVTEDDQTLTTEDDNQLATEGS